MEQVVSTTTTTRLLEGLLDPQDQATWREFDARYRPIICGLAMRLGLGPDDTAEVAQETMAEFVRDYRRGAYDRDRGRLRSWILGIARHRISDALRQRARRRERPGEPALEELPDDRDLEALWQAEQERAILSLALTEIREHTKTDGKTIRVFEMVAIEGARTAVVAADAGISVAEVYRVKNRITKRLRGIVRRLTTAYSECE